MFRGRFIAEIVPDCAETSKERVGLLTGLFDFLILWYYFFSGTTALRPAASVFWIGMALCGMIVFQMHEILLTRYFGLCLLGWIAVCASIPASVDPGGSVKYALSIAVYMLVACQITGVVGNAEVLLKMMTAFSVLLAAVTLVQAHRPEVYNAVFLPLLPRQFDQRIRQFAQNGAYVGMYNQTSANAVAMSLGCCLGIYWYNRSEAKSLACRLAAVLLIAVFMYGVVLTNRRGSAIAIAVVLAFFVFGRLRKPCWKAMAALALGLFFLSGSWRNISAIENLLDKTAQYAAEGDVLNGRMEIWRESLRLFLKRPVLGYGADAYSRAAIAEYAHNSYLQSMVELGLPGAIVFYLPFAHGFLTAFRLFRKRRLLSNRDRSIVEFAFCWQMFCFMNALYESLFSAELSVFMIYTAQFMCMHIAEEARSSGIL